MTALSGLLVGFWCELCRSTAMMSAFLPISSEPILSSMCSARAPLMVAMRSIWSERRWMRRSGLVARVIIRPVCISSIMSVVSTAAGESVPSPTVIPAAKNLMSGAEPMLSFALMRGQYAMSTPFSARVAISSSSTCTQCTASISGTSRMSQFETYLTGETPAGSHGGYASLRRWFSCSDVWTENGEEP